MADDILVTWIAILGGALPTLMFASLGHLYRRVHELRDRMRELEVLLDTLQPITQAVPEASAKEFLTPLKGGRRRV